MWIFLASLMNGSTNGPRATGCRRICSFRLPSNRRAGRKSPWRTQGSSSFQWHLCRGIRFRQAILRIKMPQGAIARRARGLIGPSGALGRLLRGDLNLVATREERSSAAFRAKGEALVLGGIVRSDKTVILQAAVLGIRQAGILPRRHLPAVKAHSKSIQREVENEA